MTSRKIITVDGLLGTGKTSISKLLAKELGYAYLSSGMFYRGLAFVYGVLEGKKDFEDESKIIETVSSYKFELKEGKENSQILIINGKDETKNLFSDLVTQSASKIAKHFKVREFLIDFQRLAFPNKNLVAEGRDMGSVIFPEAGLKFYVKVDAKVKAERRFNQMYKDQNVATDKAKELKIILKKEIEERDERDLNREHSPTIIPKNAIIIDNSTQTLTQVVKNMYDLAVSQY